MPVILIEKDLFSELDDRLALNRENGATGNRNVRRPLWGLRVKDPTFAWLGVWQDLGEGGPAQPISIIDSSSPGGFASEAGTHNFILQAVSEQRQEKVQIIETFGDHFAFFYGQKPIILSVQGMLFNSSDFNWKNEFLANYDRFLRGTKCVENKTRVFLGFDDVIAQGYLLNVQINYDKDMPVVVPFSFNMLLTKPPLDLSKAASALDNPDPGTLEPGQYRTLEGDPRGPSGYLPEYINTGAGDSLLRQPLYKLGIDGRVQTFLSDGKGGIVEYIEPVPEDPGLSDAVNKAIAAHSGEDPVIFSSAREALGGDTPPLTTAEDAPVVKAITTGGVNNVAKVVADYDHWNQG